MRISNLAHPARSDMAVTSTIIKGGMAATLAMLAMATTVMEATRTTVSDIKTMVIPRISIKAMAATPVRGLSTLPSLEQQVWQLARLELRVLPRQVKLPLPRTMPPSMLNTTAAPTPMPLTAAMQRECLPDG